MLASRRLPGIRITNTPPQLEEVLPRMDVAVFVGFAQMGPTHRPVAIESVTDYVRVFGGDFSLAWNDEQGELIYAYLAASVRAFFANGGRRCWVIRVARTALLEATWRKIPLKDVVPAVVADVNRFSVPGVLKCVLMLDGNGEISDVRLEPAQIQSSSVGSWSDGLRIQTALLAKNFEIFDCVPTFSPPTNSLDFRTREPLKPGDFIEFDKGITLDGERVRRFALIDKVTVVLGSGTESKLSQVTAKLCLDFQPVHFDKDLPTTFGQGNVQAIGFENGKLSADLEIVSGTDSKAKIIFTNLKPSELKKGQWLRWENSSKTIWLRIDNLGYHNPKLDIDEINFVEGLAWWEKKPELPKPLPTRAAVLTIDLRAISQQTESIMQGGVGLSSSHPASWWQNKSDDLVYSEPNFKFKDEASKVRVDGQNRFPLAAIDSEIGELIENKKSLMLAWIPLGVSALFETEVGSLPQKATGLERDGLANFNEELFLDPGLAELKVDLIVDQAEFIRHFSDKPRDLFGIHAALSIGTYGLFNEASLIAVPDAVHLGWNKRSPENMPSKHGVEPKGRACEKPGLSLFINCNPNKGDPTPDNNPITVTSEKWVQATQVEYEQNSEIRLLRMHRAMLRLAAGSGELFAVLGLPRHYHVAEALRHVSRLRGQQSDIFDKDNRQELFFNEKRALSYGAIYHPWPVFAEQAPLGTIPGGDGQKLGMPQIFRGSGNVQRICPADGIACGMLAVRAATRGAWIAPANQILKDVVALAPQLPESAWLSLQEAQINLLRADARGFLTLSADTLSDEPELRPINVRRLLILLRRLALRRGISYVFEPNDDVLKRAVDRGFTFLLTDLFRRGAFAGATPAESFRVVTGGAINTNADRDNGRFFVELRIAPSLPFKFLTIRLTQNGERFAVFEGA